MGERAGGGGEGRGEDLTSNLQHQFLWRIMKKKSGYCKSQLYHIIMCIGLFRQR